MMVPEMLQRVASRVKDVGLHTGVEISDAQAIDIAHAAIAAMREPTVSMANAGRTQVEEELADTESISTAEVWRTMIDAALRA
jgi:hypothetical protein